MTRQKDIFDKMAERKPAPKRTKKVKRYQVCYGSHAQTKFDVRVSTYRDAQKIAKEYRAQGHEAWMYPLMVAEAS